MALRVHPRSSTRSFDWEYLCATYEKLVSPNDTVLEIGASTAERTRWLAAKCKEVIGVEYFAERLPEVPANARFIVGDWQRLSECIEPNSIDLAVASHVIEHVQDDLRALDELHGVLKPGGAAIINTPNRKRLTRAIVEVFTGERKFPWWEHVREYTEPDLCALLQRSRFQNWEIEGVCFGLHGGPLFCYSTAVPSNVKAYANFWQVVLRK
jgi:ubiquinone/menaquinone biosynthesis C-methylase UbiE